MRIILLTDEMIPGYWANVNKKPVIFDPVGVGATAHRRATAKGEKLYLDTPISNYMHFQSFWITSRSRSSKGTQPRLGRL